MSEAIPPMEPGTDKPQRKRSTGAILIRFLPALAMVAFAFAMMPQAGCGHGVFPEITSSATPTGVPTASSSASPTPATLGTTFNMRGTLEQTDLLSGTCSGATCLASAGECECMIYGGKVSSSVGILQWTADVTLNIDDCFSTGNLGGSCCTADGTFTGSSGSGKSAGILALDFTGTDCIDTTNAFASSLTGNFSVSPDSSTGKFANSTGTGQFNLFSTSTATGAGYISGLGQILVGGK